MRNIMFEMIIDLSISFSSKRLYNEGKAGSRTIPDSVFFPGKDRR